MTEERQEIVKAGTMIVCPDGQRLEVSDWCAVATDGTCYHTQAWADRRKAEKARWESRSWLRKALGLAPKGYWASHERSAPIWTGVFGSFSLW